MEEEEEDDDDVADSGSDDVAGDEGFTTVVAVGDFGDFDDVTVDDDDDVVKDIEGATESLQSLFSLSTVTIFTFAAFLDSFEAARDLCFDTEFEGDDDDDDDDDVLLSFLFTDSEAEEFWLSSTEDSSGFSLDFFSFLGEIWDNLGTFGGL